ncbi:PTS transporter subunit EIIC [Thomasclavelia sp.]|uniref:PTS transporter subunit EIIC n=1 Tax=Thomasclavelia sp. TaxID=3025757 RepID=UPI0025F6E688|nr:PTS transporter subunit EIIC [Thomasclavelia sp.]
MNYEKIINQLCQGLGGVENIKNVSHCATRFRVSLIDESKFNKEIIESIEGVKGSIKVGTQFQIIFGSEVSNVYRKFIDNYQINNVENIQKKKEGFKFKKIIADIGTYIQGAVGFIIIPLTGCGMLKAILTVLSFAGVVSSDNTTYQLFWAASDCIMYFFPVLLAVGAAKRLGCSEGMAMIMGLMMFAPTYITALNDGTVLTLFGVKVPQFSWANQFLPVLMSVYLYSLLEKFFKGRLPSILVNIVSPLAALIIMTPINFLIISNIFVIFNEVIAIPATAIAEYRIIVMPILAMLWPLLTLFGLHGAVYQTVYLIYFSIYGFDPVAITSYLCTHMAIGTVALYQGIFSKIPEKKEMGISSAITMFFGSISEPAIFGVMLKDKRLWYAQACGAGIGAVVAAILGIKNYIVGNSASLLGIAGFIGPESSVIVVLVTVIVSIITTGVLCIVFAKDIDMKN